MNIAALIVPRGYGPHKCYNWIIIGYHQCCELGWTSSSRGDERIRQMPFKVDIFTIAARYHQFKTLWGTAYHINIRKSNLTLTDWDLRKIGFVFRFTSELQSLRETGKRYYPNPGFRPVAWWKRSTFLFTGIYSHPCYNYHLVKIHIFFVYLPGYAGW